MRPTEYKSEHCKNVVEWGKLGKSRTWMAAKLDVSRECIYNWERVHPEFSDAMKRAMAHSQAYWEDAGQDGMSSNLFNGGVWGRNMGARFPEDWREKVAHVGDKGEAPIQQEVTLTADDFTRRILGAHARAATESGTGEAADQNQG